MDGHEIKRRGFLGAVLFLGNSGYSAILGLVANFLFTLYLTPAQYGLYFIILSLTASFTYFTDLGLAAALIQKNDPSEDDYYTAFTAQLLLVSVVVFFGILLTPFLVMWGSLDPQGKYLYIAMLTSLFILSFKSIPSVKLERQLQYKHIVAVQAFEQTLFYTVSAVLLIMGYGLTALTVAVIVRSLAGTISIYALTKWKPSIHIEKDSLKSILRFGIPFQSNVFLAFLKDELLTIYLAATLGLGAMGYVGWAKKWAEAPLRIVADNTNRVLFPLFSRVQEDTQKLGVGIEKALRYNSIILMPMFTIGFFCMPLLVEIIPKYNKWEEALGAFSLFLISSLFVSFTTPLINVFNATGKVKYSVSFMVLWVILNWTVVPLCARLFGYNGVALAFAINSLTWIAVTLVMKQRVQFRFFHSIGMPLIASIVLGIVLYALTHFFSPSWLLLALCILLGGLSYSATTLFLSKGKIVGEIRELALQNK